MDIVFKDSVRTAQ